MNFNDRQKIKMFHFMKQTQYHKEHTTWKVANEL